MQYNIAFVLLEYYLHWTHEHDALNCIYACVCTPHVCMDHDRLKYIKKKAIHFDYSELPPEFCLLLGIKSNISTMRHKVLLVYALKCVFKYV